MMLFAPSFPHLTCRPVHSVPFPPKMKPASRIEAWPDALFCSQLALNFSGRSTSDVVDVDSPVDGERHYQVPPGSIRVRPGPGPGPDEPRPASPPLRRGQVRVEPEDTGPWNIVPCLVSLFSFSYADTRCRLR